MKFIEFCQKGWRPFTGFACAIGILYIIVLQWILMAWLKIPEVSAAALSIFTLTFSALVAARTTEKIKLKNGQDAKSEKPEEEQK